MRDLFLVFAHVRHVRQNFGTRTWSRTVVLWQLSNPYYSAFSEFGQKKLILCNKFKVNNKNSRMTSMMLFWCFYC